MGNYKSLRDDSGRLGLAKFSFWVRSAVASVVPRAKPAGESVYVLTPFCKCGRAPAHTFVRLHASRHASRVHASERRSGASEHPGLSPSLGLNLQTLLVRFQPGLATFFRRREEPHPSRRSG